ncbi:hypothetical protein DFH09DRAFT_1029437 [Mycena vulgaris]|nr:hypothetical protein DFH09DRAFT_1029437 [Mycena vulgaris]
MPANIIPKLLRIIRFLSRLLRPSISRTWLWVRRLYLWLTSNKLSASPAPDCGARPRSADTIYPPRDNYILASCDLGSKGSPDEPEIKEELQETSKVVQVGVQQVSGDRNPATDHLQRSPPLLSSIPGVFPTAPELFERYDRGETTSKMSTKHTIHPRHRGSPRKGRDGWTAHIHPEGALYYVHDEKRIFTDTHLYDDIVFDIATSFIDKIDRFYSDNLICQNPDEDLVLDFVKNEEGGNSCGYYFVDHGERLVFWDDAFELDRMSHGREVHGVTSPQHIKTELEVQFWRHCELFPSAISLTLELVGELRDILVHNLGDAMTSPNSTAPYSVEDLLNMLTVAESMKENVGTDHGGAVCVLGRLMWIFTSQKFYLFHGEPCARLDRSQSVYGCVPRHSLLIKIVAPLLFNAPLTHLRTLHDAYGDEIVSNAPWQRITEVLNIEWQELTLFATVLLNADMAFLSISTVDNGVNSTRTTAQIASYVSVVASLGSAIVGLILARQNRDRRGAQNYIYQAAEYLGSHYESRFGFEPLAILYSLPFALLMWGTLAFLVAFLDMCFQTSDDLTRSIVAAVSSVTIFGIIWCFDQGRRSTFGLIQEIIGKVQRSLRGWKRIHPVSAAV